MRNLNIRTLLSIFVLSFLLFSSIPLKAEESVINVTRILSLKINSSINPSTLDYLKRGVKKAQETSEDLILIQMNTPGGLISTTKDILTLFGNSRIPIVIWVAPEGSSATSAGAIIASASHGLYMAEGTNIGAATPVEIGKDIASKDMRSKAVNDLKALVQSLAESKNRNAILFGQMIEKASSFRSQEALKRQLIDGIANSQEELFKQLNGRKIRLKGKYYKLTLEQPLVTIHEMTMGQKILNVFADPSFAYILFLIGAALIYLEFQAPGGFIAGGLGALSLILSGIGFQVLPLNVGALALILLSFVLFILEIYITSYGLLSLSGLLSLFFGSSLLYQTENSYIHFSQTIIWSAMAAIALFLLIVFFLIVKDLKKLKQNFNSLEGKDVTILEILEQHNDHTVYYVKVDGERWKAVSSNSYYVDDHAVLISIDHENMILTIGDY